MKDNAAFAHLTESFEAFRKDAMWLRHCYNMYRELYEADGERDVLLQRTAGAFFFDLSIILTEYVLLQIAKLTDDATTLTKSGERENLTILHLNKALNKCDLLTGGISCISDECMGCRPGIKDARNRLLAHTDRESRLSSHPIGVVSEVALGEFFAGLQKYCDAVGNVIEVGPLDFSTQPGPGDVVDLIRVLKGVA